MAFASKKFSRSAFFINTRRPTFCALSSRRRTARRIVDAPSPDVAAACLIVRKAFSAAVDCVRLRKFRFSVSRNASLTIGLMIAAKASAKELFGSFIESLVTRSLRTPSRPNTGFRKFPLLLSWSHRSSSRPASLRRVAVRPFGLAALRVALLSRYPVRRALWP